MINLLGEKTQQIQESNNLNENTSNFLDWRQRPKEIDEKITKAFNSLQSHVDSNWNLYNGDPEYNILSIPDHMLIKKLIQQAPLEQREFYVVDVGAGKFQWGKSLAEFINQQEDIPNDITLHIFGLRGEGGVENQQTIGKCKLYELTAFKVENVFAEFEKRGLFLENKLDLMISRWCFRHLVDPLGTFLQFFNWLRPGTGLILMDGFCVLNKNDTWNTKSYDPNLYLLSLLLKIKAPFLLQQWNADRSLNRFLLTKPDVNPCQLKMSYAGVEEEVLNAYIHSECVTKFEMGDNTFDFIAFENNLDCSRVVYGDRLLYNWLRKNELIPMNFKWEAKEADYEHIKEKLKIHQAVMNGDNKAIDLSLENGLDIDEADLEGNTALQLSIKNNQFSSFKFLLEKGANINLANYEDELPLEEACLLDNQEYFDLLLNKGSKINLKPSLFRKNSQEYLNKQIKINKILSRIDDEKIQTIPVNIVNYLDESQIKRLKNVKLIEKLNNANIQLISPDVVKNLNEEQFNRLTNINS